MKNIKLKTKKSLGHKRKTTSHILPDLVAAAAFFLTLTTIITCIFSDTEGDKDD